MSRESVQLAAYTALLIILLLPAASFSSQNSSCTAEDNSAHNYCTPSCGNINIQPPFRLKGDHKCCGNQSYELSCEENNIPVLRLYSGKYYVQEIDYKALTIRVVDAGVQKIKDSYFSNPLYPLTSFNFSEGDPYTTTSMSYKDHSYELNDITVPIIFLKCASPMNSSLFVDRAPCMINNKSTMYSYFMVDFSTSITSFDLGESCKITQMVMASPNSTDYMLLSCEAIYNEIAHGFKLSWIQYACRLKCGRDQDDQYPCGLSKGNELMCGYPWLDTWFGKALLQVLFILRVPIDEFFYVLKLDIILQNIYLVLMLSVIYILGELQAAKFLFAFPFVTALLIYKWRRRHLSMYDNIEDFLQNNNNLMPIRYSYSNIKKMTEGFKDKLGEGGYGSVYKAKLRSGRHVAIKMLGKSKANGQDFINEVATIGRIHHVNVVQLIGFCVEGSKRALVYDFMPNGSLDKYIFSQQRVISLNCQKMFEIALGVARGIEYLHRGCDMQILHFDIKPHNILLDENFSPKVSDFGLARLCPLDNSIVSLTAARGTMGYIAPELFYKNIGGVSCKADIYSFGMLLMEMVGRRKNLNAAAEHSSQIFFPMWVSDQLIAGKDVELTEDATEEEKNIMRKMVMVAVWCIQMKPGERPTMHKVVEMLEGEIESLQMPPKPFLYPQQMPEEEDAGENSSTTCASTMTESTEITMIADGN